jgi:hypothetical protein
VVAIPRRRFALGLTGCIEPIDDDFDDDEEDADFDPERLSSCAYWRCGELFEMRGTHHRYCRKACRSRQKKWERAQQRRLEREQAKSRAR